MPLDPAARTVIDAFAASGPPIGTVPAPVARASSLARRLVIANPEPVYQITDRTIPGPASAIPVRIYRPSEAASLPALIWFHGGGWVLGDLEMADPTCRALANTVGCVVVSVDYRLAPETPFPGAVEDAYAAVRWAAEHGAEYGIDALRIAVGGDSAGGNLAAAVSLMARDRSGPALVHQALIYPVTDHRLETESYHANAEGFLLTRSGMRWFWEQYMGTQDWGQAYAAPLHAPSLAGLPAATVITAEYDPLRDEGEAFAAKLEAADVPVTITRYDGMIHGFFGMVGVLQPAGVARSQVAAALRQAFGGPGTAD